MTSQSTYASVERFEILQEVAPLGSVRGIASPKAGPKPCAISIVVGQSVISIAEAVTFSVEAQQRNVRQGWCGFEIGGFGQALAMHEDVELRCMASGEVKARWDSLQLAVELNERRSDFLTVEKMLENLQNQSSCTELEQLMPFALALARKGGPRLFLKGTFQYFLGRELDVAAENEFARDYESPDSILDCWHRIVNSPEYKMKARSWPGPFDPTFPFPVDILDQH